MSPYRSKAPREERPRPLTWWLPVLLLAAWAEVVAVCGGVWAEVFR
jgi:hypothetical protein